MRYQTKIKIKKFNWRREDRRYTQEVEIKIGDRESSTEPLWIVLVNEEIMIKLDSDDIRKFLRVE